MRFFGLGFILLFILWAQAVFAQSWTLNPSAPPIPKFKTVLFIPGAGGQGTELVVGPLKLKGYFSEFKAIFDRYGIPSISYAVSETGNESIDERVDDLRDYLMKNFKPGDEVLLIGHSMGGLKGRLVLRFPEVWSRLAGLIQLASPNLGTDIVDYILDTPVRTTIAGLVSAAIGFNINHKEYFSELSYKNVSKNYMKPIDFQKGMPPIFTVVVGDTPYRVGREMLAFGVGAQLMANRLSSLTGKEKLKLGTFGTLSDGAVPEYSQYPNQWKNQPNKFLLGTFKGSHGTIIGKTFRRFDRRVFEAFALEFVDVLIPNTVPAQDKKRANCNALLYGID